MDNAAKALILAGGIMIAVMIVSVAMYVFRGAQGFAIDSNEQATRYAVQAFNKSYESFFGADHSITGYNVLNVYRKAEDDRLDKEYEIEVNVRKWFN